MLPLLAIGGVIGALMSIGKGASWVADQLAPAHDATATADKSAATPQTAQAAAFETALAAQAAGQTVPGANNAVQPPSAAPAMSSLSGSIIQLTHGTDYDVQARIQAGIAAYGNVGERHGAFGRAATSQDNGVDTKPPMVDWDSIAHKTSVIAGS